MLTEGLCSSLSSGKTGLLLQKLTGRLGNQLWGLSEAYRLANHFQREVLLDLGDSPISSIPLPILDYIRNQDWLEIRKFKEVIPRIEFTPVTEEIYSGGTNHNYMFQGFIPSYEALRRSGLFQEGQKPDFFGNKGTGIAGNFLTIHVRRGDYVKNPHLGVLPSTYYEEALNIASLRLGIDDLPIVIKGDEITEKIIKVVPKRYRSRILKNEGESTLLEDFETLCSGLVSISSNSTLSYLASYLSLSRHIFIPNPFYLAIPGWTEKLSNSRTIEIKYTQKTNLRYLTLRARKRLSRSK